MIGSAFRSHSGRNRLSGQCRDEALGFSDQWHRAGSRRKSLGVKYIYNKNNNISIHYMYMYMSMCTRTYESLSDVLWQMRDCQGSCCLFAPTNPSQLIWPRTGPLTRRNTPHRLWKPIKRENASNGHGGAHNASDKAAGPSWANRYFRQDSRRKIGLGTDAKVEKVCFTGQEFTDRGRSRRYATAAEKSKRTAHSAHRLRPFPSAIQKWVQHHREARVW
jgi:hypothetical protein